MNPYIGKYSVPVISASAIKRTRLVSQIQTLSERNILFIHAPIGYGKTTSAVQWIAANNVNTAWLSLDEYDSSEGEFYRGLLLAFLNGNRDSANTELIQSVINNEEFDALPMQYTLDVFSKFDFAKGPNAVIIDDFHLFCDPSVALSLPVLRSRLPMRLRMIVISRNPPTDILKDYLLKGIIKLFSLENFQFTSDEVLKLFSKHGIKLSTYDAEKILSQTIGWPVALNALLLSKPDSRKQAPFLNDKSKDNAYLYEYIKNQIHGFWDKETRSILLKTSVCDFITPELCEALTSRQNAWNILERLSRKTGLIMRYGTESFRYQSLLKDFLTAEMEADSSIDKNALYRVIGIWYKDNGNIPAAIDMAFGCGDIRLLEDISRLHSYAYGRYSIGVESYVREVHTHVLSRLPEQIIENSPRLCLESWFATYVSGSYSESLKWMSAVKKYVPAEKITSSDDMFMAFFSLPQTPKKTRGLLSTSLSR